MFARIIFFILLIVNVILAYRVVWSDSGIITYLRLKEEYNKLNEQNEKVKLENKKKLLKDSVNFKQKDIKIPEKIAFKKTKIINENQNDDPIDSLIDSLLRKKEQQFLTATLFALTFFAFIMAGKAEADITIGIKYQASLSRTAAAYCPTALLSSISFIIT